MNENFEMKKREKKRRELTLRPSPNEEANILQSEKEKRKKLRLKQVREQEKAFSRRVLGDARRRKTVEMKNLASHLKSQWENEQNKKKSVLEKKYQESLDEVGLGHRTASEDQTNYNEPELSEEEKRRALERYKKALEQLMYDKTKSTQSERERAEARHQALETERLRAANIAALPPPVDPIGDFYLKKDQKTSEQKNVNSFSTTRFHLQPSVHVERDLDPNQENARQAAIDEEQRMQTIMEDVQRDKVEQTEKARLRHKHALATLQLEEDHKKLLKELDHLERHDRQRRQDAVARIPVRIFQPPHKRLEDAEDRQRNLEQAFEDMYMMQTGYTGDLTVALEPPDNMNMASEDSVQSESDQRSMEFEEGREPLQRVRSAIGRDKMSEREDHEMDQEKEPKEALPRDNAPKAHSEDPLRRLLKRIERQRDQWRRRQLTEEPQPQAAVFTDIPRTWPSTTHPSRMQGYRVPDTIPFSASPESLAEAELSGEEAEDVTTGGPHPETSHPAPVHDELRPAVNGERTLLHPLEAAQRSRTTTPSGREVTAPLTHQEALLEQQKLKLKLQQQTLLQQQLEQQLQEYQRQLTNIYGPAGAPGGPSVPGLGTLEQEQEPFSGGAAREGTTSFSDTGARGVQAPQGTALPIEVPTVASQEGSPMMSDALESSTLSSLTSDEPEGRLPSEFERTLAAARATADKAAELRQRERDVLQELSRVALEDVPFSGHTHSERDSSSESTLRPQSRELVNVSTPSTLSLSVTMPSELSVTAAASRTLTSRYLDHSLPSISQPSRSPFFDVADTASITAATSLLTKTSQHHGLPRDPSSSARSFSVLSSASVYKPRISGVLPSSMSTSRVIAERSRSNPLTFVTTSGSGQATAVPQSSASQQSSPSYSPGYLDYYQQKMEEERQFFEAQRNRIRRYSDTFKKPSLEVPGTQTYKAPESLSKNAPLAEARLGTAYLSDLDGSAPTGNMGAIGLDTNKENQGYIANSVGLMGQDRLRDISQRLGAFEKSLTSNVTTSGYTVKPLSSKPLSTSEGSYGSSTEYFSLPRNSAGRDYVDSAGSALSSLSELTEMMTRLTSTSDETEDNSSRDGATGEQHLAAYTSKRIPVVGQGTTAGQSSLTNTKMDQKYPTINSQVYTPHSLSSFTSGPSSTITKGPLDAEQSDAPMEQCTKLLGAKEPGSRWTRGSDGKQWFVLSRSNTLSSVGMLSKDNIYPEGEGEENVFLDIMESKSTVAPGSEETGSIASIPSGTLRSGTAKRLNGSITNSGSNGRSSSKISSASDGSHEGSSHVSGLHGDSSSQSRTGELDDIVANEPK